MQRHGRVRLRALLLALTLLALPSLIPAADDGVAQSPSGRTSAAAAAAAAAAATANLSPGERRAAAQSARAAARREQIRQRLVLGQLRRTVTQQRQQQAGAVDGAAAADLGAGSSVSGVSPATAAAVGVVGPVAATRPGRARRALLASPPPPAASSSPPPRMQPPPKGAAFQYQLGQKFEHPRDAVPGVGVYFIDGFDTDAATVARMRAAGLYPVCYISAAYEDWRADAGQWPREALGRPMSGWPGERWVDTRHPGVLKLLRARLDMCRRKGFLAADVDNVDAAPEGGTGFSTTRQDNAALVERLAGAAHALGLAYGVKNFGSQAARLAKSVDFAVVESCARYDECGLYAPLAAAGKPVFAVEYERAAFERQCRAAAAAAAGGGRTQQQQRQPWEPRPILKSRELKAFPRAACPGAP